VKHVLDVLLRLFDSHQPGVGWGAPSAAHDSPWAHNGNHRHRRTYIIPDGHSRPPHMATASSSQSCHPTIAHLSSDARSSQRAEEWAAPNQHAWADTCGKIPAGSSLHSW